MPRSNPEPNSLGRRRSGGAQHPSAALSRRDWLRLSACGAFGCSLSGWLPALAAGAPQAPQTRACILLWMTGGPSQLDTFDPKPGHANGGEFRPIDTAVPGVQISEHLPRIAAQMQHLALVRSMRTSEGDHDRGTFLMRTGYRAQGPLQYPTLGSLLSKELGSDEAELPSFVSVAPYRFRRPAAYGPGFLGPKYAPLVIAESNRIGQIPNDESYEQDLKVRNLDLPRGIDAAQADARLELLNGLDTQFISAQPGLSAESHRTAYRRAVRMMRSQAIEAFSLEHERPEVRDAYGRNQFGQGCLLARRLVERGVPFVEVSLNGAPGSGPFGWDSHRDNFAAVKSLCEVLDPAWAALISDLKDRGLLDSTLIVWMGEFGRTPVINASTGRDHFPAAWTTVLAGAGIRGGQVIGRTTDDGMEVAERPVAQGHLMATICRALRIDPGRQNMSNLGRPIRIADPEAEPIQELLA